MIIYTIGFTKKTAKEFFEKIKTNNIELLVDIRLNNVSQLAGFAKGRDLEYFLKEICNCRYEHNILFAPTKELLDNYRNKKVSWNEYEIEFKNIMEERNIINIFKEKYSNIKNICLLCTESTADQCHRRLVAEFLENNLSNIKIIHI